MSELHRTFYNSVFKSSAYSNFIIAETHPYFLTVKTFIETYDLWDRRCLEIGCGRGAFQDLVNNYIGVDISASAGQYLHKPFCQGDGTLLPFQNHSFDAVWTIDVHEDILEPGKAVEEIRRVLKPGGVLLFAPAWHTRSWFAKGCPVRTFRELWVEGYKDVFIKASILFRDFSLFRYSRILLRRLVRYLAWKINRGQVPYKYKKLSANYDQFWMPDSDACNSLDPVDTILWFVSRGDECLSCPGWLDWLFFGGKGLVFRKNR